MVLALGLAACFGPRPATVPLRTIEIKPAAPGSRALVVLLIGRRDRPEDFARAGFGELAARAGVGARLVAVDAHPGYYFGRTIVERLRADVIGPARAQGVERIWLAGVSLGGTGSILYSIEHPEDVSGIALFAPFLGDEDMRKELEAAGGLGGWSPPQPLGPTDFQRRMWAWLKRYEGGSEGRMPIYLGWGTRDRFAGIDGTLGSVLPTDRVFTTPGGHTWRAWRALWEKFLATGALRDL
jgi:pimeloyl-ACP methyl ester carboxylesterase